MPQSERDRIAPDVYGLPIYRIDRVHRERVGDEIHMICGTELFGQVQWTCIFIVKASFAAVECSKTVELASVPAPSIRMVARAAH